MRFFVTKEADWLKKWDIYVSNAPLGNHLVYSDWLMSYKHYGFDFEVGLVVDDRDCILAGFGAVIPKVLFFKFYIIPLGPIITDFSEVAIKQLFDGFKQRAKKIGCCATQISIPYSSYEQLKNFTYQPDLFAPYLNGMVNAKCFNFIYAGYGLNWLDLNNFDNNEQYINSLSPKVRRNIRIPMNKGLRCMEAKKMVDLSAGYRIIEENAKEAGYAVREFEALSDPIFNLISKQLAKMLLIIDKDEVKAAGLFIATNKGYTNIMSGAKRTKPDLKLGYMLHYMMISESIKLKKSGYDISMGGSAGVLEFKNRFSADVTYFENPHYFKVLKPIYFKLYKVLETKLKPYKNSLAKILKTVKSPFN